MIASRPRYTGRDAHHLARLRRSIPQRGHGCPRSGRRLRARYGRDRGATRHGSRIERHQRVERRQRIERHKRIEWYERHTAHRWKHARRFRRCGGLGGQRCRRRCLPERVLVVHRRSVFDPVSWPAVHRQHRLPGRPRMRGGVPDERRLPEREPHLRGGSALHPPLSAERSVQRSPDRRRHCVELLPALRSVPRQRQELQ